MAGESEKGARDNHGQAIIICLHLLFYPLSPVDTANGIARLCHSKSHFCPPRACLCWQSERMRGEKKKGGKEPTEAFFNMAFCQFPCACQNEKQCLVARLVGESLGRSWSLSVGKVVETSYWRGTTCCYKLAGTVKGHHCRLGAARCRTAAGLVDRKTFQLHVTALVLLTHVISKGMV